MTDNVSFTQKVANFGFNPPQNRVQTFQKKIADDQRQETHFFNMGCDGNEFKTNDLGIEKGTFWTVCPYCNYMYEYGKKYEECRLLCKNCRKGFHAMVVAAPPEGFLVRGKGRKYYSGYGFFQLGYSGNSLFGGKKDVGRGDTGKKHVVEISDDSDDEKKEMDVRNEAGKVKVGLNNGEKRGVMKRVKFVSRNIKKIEGRGVKGRKIEKVSVVEINVQFENGVAAGDYGSDDGIRLQKW